MINSITGSLVVYNNSINQLKALLDSLSNQPIELIVVDNSTTDKLKDLFENRENIRYVFVNKNIGFGAGHNLAFKMVADRSSFHFIINPDVYFGTGLIEGMVRIMDADASIGVLGPNVKYPDGTSQFSCRLLPCPLDLLVRRFPFRSWREAREQKNELRFTNYQTRMEVPFLLGCFLCVRSSVYSAVGGFDERYFMYMEDSDLCRTINQTHKVIFDPTYTIFHFYSKGSASNFKLLLIHIRSAFQYFNKWGWFFDYDRIRINKYVLKSLNFIGVFFVLLFN